MHQVSQPSRARPLIANCLDCRKRLGDLLRRQMRGERSQRLCAILLIANRLDGVLNVRSPFVTSQATSSLHIQNGHYFHRLRMDITI